MDGIKDGGKVGGCGEANAGPGGQGGGFEGNKLGTVP